jgi:hypothetical protein
MAYPFLNRRLFLAGLAASGALAACGQKSVTPTPILTPPPSPKPTGTATAGPTATAAPTPSSYVHKLTVDASQSDLPADVPVYMYVVGLVKTAGAQTFYRLEADGTPKVMQTTDSTNPYETLPGSSLPTSVLKENYPTQWADYSIELSRTEPTSMELAKLLTIPGLGTGTSAFSGRIYISVGEMKLPFTPTSGGYIAPVTYPGPGYLSLYDWIEFSFDSSANFNGNTTQVDQFGFPLTLDGTPGGTLQGVLTSSRSAILAGLTALAAPFSDASFQVAVPAAAASAYPPGVSVIRAISPKTITGSASVFGYSGDLLTYYDDAVSNAYTTWQTTPLLTHDTSTGYYTGYVPTSGANAGSLAFYAGNFSTVADIVSSGESADFVIPVPTSEHVFNCDGPLATGSAQAKNAQKVLAAALNRGVVSNSLDDATCAAGSGAFYTGTQKWNRWSAAFHGYSQNALAYGFPYDDVCDQNPSIGLTGTTSVTIVVGNFA